MLQYVCHDDDIEFRFVRENFSPGGGIEIGAVDAFAERCEGCNDLFVDLDGRDTAAEGIAQTRVIEPGPAPISRTRLAVPTNRTTRAGALPSFKSIS